MIYIIILLILIIFLLFFYFNNKINNVCNNLEYFIYGNKTSNTNTILILGGIHGNEPAGKETILNLMNDINTNIITIKNNKLILVPYVNYCALQLNIRSIPTIGDLNRKFPSTEKYDENTLHPIIKKLLVFIKEADFIIDFHEGWGYYKDKKGSIGSTISPSIFVPNDLVDIIYNNINFTILTDNDEYIKNNPVKYGKTYNIKNTLQYFANNIKKKYILIETSGQNNIQSMDIRTKQGRTIINSILNYYNTF